MGGFGGESDVKREAADCATLELRSARVLNCKCVNCQLCEAPSSLQSPVSTPLGNGNGNETRKRVAGTGNGKRVAGSGQRVTGKGNG